MKRHLLLAISVFCLLMLSNCGDIGGGGAGTGDSGDTGGEGTPGITVSKTSVTVSENLTTDTFTVAPDTRPADGEVIVVTVISGDTGEATVNPALLTFTNSSWSARTVTVTGVDDALLDGAITFDITLAIVTASTTANDYDSVTIPAVSCTNTDNDSAVAGIDLVVAIDSITADGLNVTFSYTASNLGDTDATVTTWIDFFINSTSAPSIGDWGDCAEQLTAADLTAGASVSGEKSCTSAATSGTAYAIIDTDGLEDETNEDNNITSGFVWPSGVDLVVQIDGVTADGSSVTFIYTASNLGDTDATVGPWIDLFINSTSAPSIGDWGDCPKQLLAADLAAGASVSGTKTCASTATSGTAYAIIDTDGLEAEANEDNNITPGFDWTSGGGAESYSIGGSASGISGSVALQNNGGDDLEITADGSFTFPLPLADGAGYEVTMVSSTGQACTLSNATGTVSGADVTNVALECTAVLVEPLYFNNGTNWNDYIVNDGADIFSATDTACDPVNDGPGYDACLHGGERRAVSVTGKTSCTGLTAVDTLGAFDWTCDESTSPIRMVSTGLKDGKNLSDLIDFTTPDWKNNSVMVSDGGSPYLVTTSTKWWTNPVAVDNNGGDLATEGTIYVVTGTDNLERGFYIDASKVGLVAAPEAIINGPGAGSNIVSASATRPFLWLEGVVDATGDDCGVYMTGVKFSVLRNVAANNGSYGVYLLNSSNNNTLSGVTVANNSFGVVLYISSYNTLSGVTAANNYYYGVHLYKSSNNTLSRVTAANNNEHGVYLYGSSRNTLSGVTATNNNITGVYLEVSSNNNTLTGVTAANNYVYGVHLSGSSHNTLTGVTAASNNERGVYLYGSSNNTLSRVTAANNNEHGVYLEVSSNNTLSGVTATNNSNTGVYLDSSSNNNTLIGVTAANNSYGVVLANSSNNYFTGLLKVGNNPWGDCYVYAFDGADTTATNPGLDDDSDPSDVETDNTHSGLCVEEGTAYGGLSDFGTATTGITLASSFVDKVTSDDTVNTSDTDGTADYPADPDAFDWSGFENPYRSWGGDGTFGDNSSRGQWSTGTGRIWDWSLLSSDAVVKDALSLPTGSDTLTHTWSAANATDCGAIDGAVWGTTCTSTFLRNAVEIYGVGLGNDNTLCESNETCLYTPNIGSYQGHGGLVGETFTPGTLTGITLMKYGTNGR